MKKVLLIFLVIQSSAMVLFGQDYDPEILKKLSKGGNQKRFRFLKRHLISDSTIAKYFDQQAIDWIGIYKNIVVSLPGKSDSIVYITCHYDKVDGNIIAAANVLLNGGLDILLSGFYLSRGVFDNGTGVLVATTLLKELSLRENYYTYKFLFTGQEEYGLRGARSHVARLNRGDYNKIKYAINVDMVGGTYSKEIGVAKDVSDPRLLTMVKSLAAENNFELYFEDVKKSGGTSDFEAFSGTSFGKDFLKSLKFNLIGAFIPQRSYFTKPKRSIPLINFSDRLDISFSETVSGFSPLSFGKIHSFRDRQNKIDPMHLKNYILILREMIKQIDSTH
jgi:hypothetical protein